MEHRSLFRFGVTPVRALRTAGALVLSVSALAGCTDPPTAPKPDPIEPTAPAPIYGIHVPAEIVNDCSVEVTSELEAWIASVPDSSVLSFDPGACYNVERGLWITDRHSLTFEGNGSTFQVFQRGESGRGNWNIQGGSNIVLRRMIARGANPYAGIDPRAYDPKVEWQHAYRFQATQGATLDSVEAYDVHGDFVEAEPDHHRFAWPGEPVRNLVVKNSRFERSGRMGIGLTHVDGFRMENTYVAGVPMSAVDLELDTYDEVGRNIVVVGNTFGRTWHSIFSNIGQGETETVNVVFSNNVMVEPAQTCQPPIVIATGSDKHFRTSYVIENNTLVTGGAGIDIARVRELTLRGNDILWTSGLGCGDNMGIRLQNTHRAWLSGNRIIGAPEQIVVDSLSTEIEVR